MNPEWLTQSAELVVAVAGALGVIIVGIKKVYKMARNIEMLVEKLDTLSAETRPNGGATLRDAVDRVELKLNGLSTRVERLESQRITRGVL